MSPADAIAEAIEKLAGSQAISLDEAFRLLIEGEGDPDLMPSSTRNGLCEVLRGFGYRECFMAPVDAQEARLMWVRRLWPLDVAILSGRTVARFRQL
jgi:hypothetical protein